MAHPEIPHSRKAILIGIGVAALVLLGVVAGFVVLLSGAYTTAATKQHFALTYKVLDAGLRYSVKAASRDIEVPALDGSDRIAEGVACYQQHCVQCHGAPGVARSALGMGMLPSPSSMAQSGHDWSAEELYYLTSNGVRMAGMPAWRFRIAEDGLWSIVALLKRMPHMTTAGYADLVRASGERTCPQNVERTDFDAADSGATMFRQYACHNCHRMDGVVGPNTYAGPDLSAWSGRKYIAGVLPNTRINLARWIEAPREVSPDTLMPDLGVPPAHAKQLADFLLERR